DRLAGPQHRGGLDPVGGEHRGGGVTGAVVDDEGEIDGAGGLQAGGETDGAEAAGGGDRLGCSWERGRGREMVEVPGGRRGGPRRPQGARAVRDSPVVSGRPSARFRDWIAAPAVPLTRLSSAEITVAWPLRRSTAAPMRRVFAPVT